MKKIIIILSLLISTTSFSAEKVVPSIFADLGSLFHNNRADLWEMDDMVGAWSGRCYFGSSPDTPYASLLVISKGETGQNGPLFPPFYYSQGLTAPKKPSSFFDNLDPNDKKLVQEEVGALRKDQVQDTLPEDPTLNWGNTIKKKRGDKWIDHKVALSVYNRDSPGTEAVFITQHKRIESLNLKQTLAEKAYLYCYYFKKITL